MNFAKRELGKKPSIKLNIIPEKLTKRHCASKLGEIYDLLGKITPLRANFEVDLHDLVKLKINWDDEVPTELRST